VSPKAALHVELANRNHDIMAVWRFENHHLLRSGIKSGLFPADNSRALPLLAPPTAFAVSISLRLWTFFIKSRLMNVQNLAWCDEREATILLVDKPKRRAKTNQVAALRRAIGGASLGLKGMRR
jgi:hypothetical protein